MIYYMFCHWHKRNKCSSQIAFDDHTPDVVKSLVVRACQQNELTKVKEAKRLQKFYYLGTYDDESMKFNILSEPEELIDFDDVIEDREAFELTVRK